MVNQAVRNKIALSVILAKKGGGGGKYQG